MKKFNIIFIILILIFIKNTSAKEINQPTLHLFQKLNENEIVKISVIDSNKAIALCENHLYKWENNKWTKFYPTIPLKNFTNSNIKAFSFKNIWVFLQKKDIHYRNQIYHYNGNEWKKISSPHPYSLYHYFFIDSTKFIASGSWGSLIYYNGKKIINIKNPGPLANRIAKIFTPKHFLLWSRKNDVRKKPEFHLYEYHHGKWKSLITINHFIEKSFFFSPDSGYFINENGILFQYINKEFNIIDSLSVFTSDFYEDAKIYYWKNNKIWQYNIITQKKKPIASVPFVCQQIYKIGKNDFFLLDQYTNVYYLGNKNIGEHYIKNRAEFLVDIFSYPPSYHFSVSSYKNENNKIDLYFTHLHEKNNFFTFNYSANKLQYKDKLLDRKLLGFNKTDNGTFFADIDNDMDMDAICTGFFDKSLLYENIGNDIFRDITEETNFKLDGRIGSVWWGDLNRDGLLDAVTGNYNGNIHIFINNDYFRLKDITDKTGIPDTLKHYFVAMSDIDNDGDLDLFLFGPHGPIRYFRNVKVDPETKIPKFEEISNLSPELTTRFDFYTQSIAFGDYDNDGDIDLFLANRKSPSKLFRNNGDGIFHDVSHKTGFNQQYLAYGANWGDLDQDGYMDLFLTTLGKNYIFWNNKGEFFEQDSTSLPDNDFGYSTGSIIEDIDQDGDLDIIVTNCGVSSSRIYRNRIDRDNYIKIKLRGYKSNTYGIGSHIHLYSKGHENDQNYLQGYRQMITNTGYRCSKLPEVYFGVIPEKEYSAVITFPSGEQIIKTQLTSGNTYLIKETLDKKLVLVNILRYLNNFIFRKNKRLAVLRFIIFLFIILMFTFFIYFRKYWPKLHIIFFILPVFLIFIITAFLFKPNHINMKWFLPIYITIITSVIFYTVIQKYTTIKYQEEKTTELYDLIRQFNHSKNGIRQIDHVTFYINNIQNRKIKENLYTELKSFHTLTIPMINNILNNGKRLGMSLKHVRNIEKTIKYLHKSTHRVIKNFSTASHQTFNQLSTSMIKMKKEILTIRKEVEKKFICDPFKIINDILSQFTNFTEVSLLNPESTNSIKVIMPPQELAQVLTNLFENALESMKQIKNKRIQISIEAIAGEELIIKIRDDGKGIPPKLHSIIFEESFSTKDSSGLGLFHARKLLRRYGGDLKLISSNKSKGSIFQITLRIHQK